MPGIANENGSEVRDATGKIVQVWRGGLVAANTTHRGCGVDVGRLQGEYGNGRPDAVDGSVELVESQCSMA
ncbi:hypothetical protein GCM10017771_67670 [Streptomyces capitiformicae]|uniref:Uncharacterized protein n=1 Tax=Streptomyces capitiformicae TaxID=2014920 RepID=A0A918ZD11_9ACTN|nr:hypothetical protein GCM10017771_67670 [Streptomyces capitiformicae]